MENLKEQLSEKGHKCKLQFSTKEREYFERECGFTDEELDIFKLRARGYSIIRISFFMEEKYEKELAGVYTVLAKLKTEFAQLKIRY